MVDTSLFLHFHNNYKINWENFQVYYSVDPTIGQVWFNSSPSLLWNWSTSTKRWGTPCLWWFGFISYRLLIFRERHKRPGEFSHLDGAATKQGDCFQVLWSLQLEERERKACKKLFCGDSTPSTFVQRKLDCGKMYKSDAWRIYLECFASLGQDMNVLPCGLVVNVTNRWLGCSKLLFPNKLVLESPNARMIRDSDLMDVALANKNFYFEAVGNSLHLKQEHPYYFQVQCQLA